MRPSVRRLEATYGDRLDFHILNIDHLSTQALAARYRIRGIPTIVLLDTRGRLVDVMLGYRTEEELIAAVEALLAGGN